MEEPTAIDERPGQDIAPEVADEKSGPFVGQWRQLVSTTNWEKGRIIYEWRESLFLAGVAPQVYSDEAWSRRVGHVSGQHVGRLRRVYERFGKVYADYQGLFWSHFQAALDWNDAEMWLEGAVQSGWSISQMRVQRWQAQGSPADHQPRDADIIAAELDEDAAADDAAAKLSAVRDPRGAATEPDDEFEAADVFADEEATDNVATPVAAAPAVRPFADLAALPDDLSAAFESFKLSILRHKLAGWGEVSRDDVLASLDALKQLAVAPS